MSNRERIARAAEEARLAEEEKVAKKVAKKAAKKPAKKAKRPSRSRAKKEVRMKIVWTVCNDHGTAVETFAYPDKDAATSAAQRLTSSTGRPHELRATKVPMD
jgi:hypothetical protein